MPYFPLPLTIVGVKRDPVAGALFDAARSFPGSYEVPRGEHRDKNPTHAGMFRRAIPDSRPIYPPFPRRNKRIVLWFRPIPNSRYLSHATGVDVAPLWIDGRLPPWRVFPGVAEPLLANLII